MTLNAGNNTIKYQYDSGNTGYINVDYIQIAAGTTGISGVQLSESLIIYPNPAKSELNIENIRSNSQVSISDVNGKLVYDKVFGNEGLAQIDIRDLKTGIYFLKVKDSVSIRTEKIIIE